MRRALALLGLFAAGGVACAHDVAVQTDPPGAHVVVDGVARGPAPITFQEPSGDAPVVVEASAPGRRPARVEVHRSAFSVPLASAGMVCGALACGACLGGSLALSVAEPALTAGIVLGVPLFAVPSILGLALGRQLPDTIAVQLEPLPPVAPADATEGAT